MACLLEILQAAVGRGQVVGVCESACLEQEALWQTLLVRINECLYKGKGRGGQRL